jgi:hypothetical protein
MRIIDYPSLVQALADFAHRSDLTPYYQYFTQFGELKIYRDIFAGNLGNGIRWIEQPLTGNIDAVTGFVSVPAGYLSLKDFQVTDGNGDQYTTIVTDAPFLYTRYPIRQPDGIPAYVARDGLNFVFGPFPSDAYAFTATYYGTATPIGPTNPSTWMTAQCSDLLFASCMMEMQPFLRDQTALGYWQNVYTQKLNGFIDRDKSERYAPGALTMQVQQGTPTNFLGTAPAPSPTNEFDLVTEIGTFLITETGTNLVYQ